MPRWKSRSLRRHGYYWSVAAIVMGLLVGLALLLHREHGVRLLPHRLAQAIGALQPQPLQITVGPADQVLPPLLSAGQANLAPVSSGETMIAPDTDHRCLDQAHGVFDNRYLACMKSHPH